MRNIIIAALAFCCILSIIYSTTAAPHVMAATVTMRVFSGASNPSWSINSQQLNYLLSLNQLELYTCNELADEQLGYNGFFISYIDITNDHALVQGIIIDHAEAELFLLSTLAKNAPTIVSTKVIEYVLHHVKDVAEQRPAFATSSIMCANGNSKKKITNTLFKYLNAGKIDSNIYIRGPDNVTFFDPSKWNVSPVQYQNNCYNYANDIRTDTFAQPGRGTGTKWQVNTCANVTAAAVRDGLVVFDRAPEKNEQPTLGHFIALCMWPDVNFHWYRKDANFLWSHKPGSTAARNTDNSGKEIADPKYANRGPYTEFCGYFIAIPSKVTIN